MDVEALEREALAAIAEARSADELEEVRVRTLGRKSPLKLALREVRDRETGMALNAVRERVEQALGRAAGRADHGRPRTRRSTRRSPVTRSRAARTT